MIHARPDYNLIQDPRGKIPQNEPVFILRGQDPKIQPCIRKWIELAKADGSDPRLIEVLEKHIILCDEWQAKIKTKIKSDMPEATTEQTCAAIKDGQVWKNLRMHERDKPYLLVQYIRHNGALCYVVDANGKMYHGVKQVMIPLAWFDGKRLQLHQETTNG